MQHHTNAAREVGLDTKLLMDFIFTGLNCAGFGERMRAATVNISGSYGAGIALSPTCAVWPFDCLVRDPAADEQEVKMWLQLLETGYEVFRQTQSGVEELSFQGCLTICRDGHGALVTIFSEQGLEKTFKQCVEMEAKLAKILIAKGWKSYLDQMGVEYYPLDMEPIIDPNRLPIGRDRRTEGAEGESAQHLGTGLEMSLSALAIAGRDKGKAPDNGVPGPALISTRRHSIHGANQSASPAESTVSTSVVTNDDREVDDDTTPTFSPSAPVYKQNVDKWVATAGIPGMHARTAPAWSDDGLDHEDIERQEENQGLGYGLSLAPTLSYPSRQPINPPTHTSTSNTVFNPTPAVARLGSGSVLPAQSRNAKPVTIRFPDGTPIVFPRPSAPKHHLSFGASGDDKASLSTSPNRRGSHDSASTIHTNSGTGSTGTAGSSTVTTGRMKVKLGGSPRRHRDHPRGIVTQTISEESEWFEQRD